jgi:serine phosphatase RsbU (regulator of sigma subunit)
MTEVEIYSGETSFTLGFSALDFTAPEENRYEYIMEGYDRGWIKSGKKNTATYTNLKYGKYTFMVRGTNNDDILSQNRASIRVYVKSSVLLTRFAIIIYILLALIWVYLFFLYRTRSLRRSNQLLKEKELAGIEIAAQKEQLSLKNKNITESINYAKRIQEAMLPSPETFSKFLPESFVFYNPKDIVSGDFYWINQSGNKIFLAAVDCTGHGVPGALMSMIGNELIRNIINVQKITEPAQILDKLNYGISDSFNKEIDRITLKDGMDLSFCVLDLENKMLEFAGAFNPIYLVRDEKITEMRGNRYSVGLAEDPNRQKFTNHVVPLLKNDIIYMFTDGYVDQFGGPKDKKFMYRRFRHLLLTIHKLNMEQQLMIIKDTIEEWTGKMEQIDDILVIGFRPPF